ncbi:MAG: hypothetical protein L0Y56_01280 [Nitrospira sp.]|nr:hypothetical protein [Nitrospira sp.]
MKVYISGSFSRQKELREIAQSLQALGFSITSTWLNEGTRPLHMTSEEWRKALAIKDLADLAEADCIIMEEFKPTTHGGRYVEWGFALAYDDKLKILVQPMTTKGVFQMLADVTFKDWDETKVYLSNRFPPKS